ncbi:tetraspanin-15-like [Dreissena polymorpha]|uniref:Tetraspanin n=1 Tax=Dreissena polymorpha TaxID=45954 RepID=A0A9D4LN55_DREPO|nr:tetraspanin-15-like [Dreissena polymorpha]KAH3861875.1 hypothetical protein DPMN_024828 [Dreissena polymorpha]
MAVEFDGERMLNNKSQSSTDSHPKKPLCACTAYSCNKLILLLIASVYVLAGAGLLSVGVWVVFQVKDYEALNNDLFLPALLLIGVGLIITVIAFFGVAGVVRENNCLLIFYLVVTVLLFLTQVGIGVLAFIHRQKVPDMTSKDFMPLVKDYHTKTSYRQAMDNLQTSMRCCGLDSFNDYEENKQFQCAARTAQKCGVPWSCCVNNHQDGRLRVDCGFEVRFNTSMPTTKIHGAGCTDLFLTWLSKTLDFVGIVALATSIPQIISILLAYFLVRQIREMRMWYRVEM